MTRLVHPETGGEFDAPPSAVPTYQRAGWAIKDQAPAKPAPKTAAGPSAEAPKES